MTYTSLADSNIMPDPYYQFLDMKIILRDVQSHFHTYSAQDIKKLIAAKMKSKREPKALQQLYELEKAITELRLALDQEPPAKAASLQPPP